MIQIDVAAGKKGRLLIQCFNCARESLDAIHSLLSTNYSPKQEGFLVAVSDFHYFLDRLKAFNSPDMNAHMSCEAQALVAAHYQDEEHFKRLKVATPDWEFLESIPGWKTKPYSDQLQCVKFHVERKRSLEGSETGIGKTLVLLYTFLHWKARGAKRGLILCMNSGKLDWEKEVYQHTDLSVLTVGNGSNQIHHDLSKFTSGNYDLLILHYDCLFQDSRSKVCVFDIVKKLSFDFVGVDEVHMLKNPSSKRHKRVVSLLEGLGSIPLVCATGTAIDGNPRSAWAPLKLVAQKPSHYFPSYAEFSRHFVIREPRFFGRQKVMVDTGFKNLRRLREMVEPSMIRFLKSEVLDRPSKIFQNRNVELHGDQAKLYNEVKRQIRQEITTQEGDKISLANAATKLLRLRQILNHPLVIRDVENYSGGSAKYAELDFLAEEILSHPDSKLLVWTQWKAAVDLLVKRYRGYGSIAYYGGSDDRVVRDKVLSGKARVIVAIPEKAGTSVDWLKCCRTAVYLEKPWSLTLYRQSLDRIDRRSNTDAALIVNITVPQSVDGFVDAVLQKHQEVFDALTLDEEKIIDLGKDELLKYLD
jgi:SNF2 family DNA or RNA helicase